MRGMAMEKERISCAETKFNLEKIQVRIKNKILPTPFIIGSSDMIGTCAQAEQAVETGGELIGAITWKSTTLKPTKGFNEPTVCDYNEGFLVASGMKNTGIEQTLDEIARFKKNYPDVILIVSIATMNFDDPAGELSELAKHLRHTGVDGIELNLSCPHQVAGEKYQSKTLSQNIKSVKKIVCEVHKAIGSTELFLGVKLTGWQSDVGLIAQTAEKEGADFITVSNIFPGIGYYTGFAEYHNGYPYKIGQPLLGNFKGGYTGKSLLPATLLIVNTVKNSVKIPVWATGGCMSSNDAMIQAFFAGASAIVSSTFYYSQDCVGSRDFYEELNERKETLIHFMSDNHYESIQNIAAQNNKSDDIRAHTTVSELNNEINEQSKFVF